MPLYEKTTQHYFEAPPRRGRITSAYWAEKGYVTAKQWKEDHDTALCEAVGGACAYDNPKTECK